MKILICSADLYAGGAETVLHTIVERLLKEGQDITLLASPSRDKDIKGTIYEHVHFIRARIHKKTGKRFSPVVICNFVARKLYRLYSLLRVNLHKYDVCIAIKEGVEIKDCSYVRAKKRILFIHCDLRAKSFIILSKFPSFQAANSFIAEHYDKVVCVSETAREGYLETIGDTNNLCVLYNPIDWNRIRMLAKEECSYSKNPERPLIIAVGRLDDLKNYMTLLKACSLIKDKISFDLWIIGDGPQYDMLEEYIHCNDLSFVKMFGKISNPYPLMRQGDLFVSTSLSESYGLAIQESLVLGVPVIAVNCQGVAESFDKRYGVLIENSADELGKTILDVLDTPLELLSYRNNIRDYYSVSSIYEERLDKICKLLETCGAVD